MRKNNLYILLVFTVLTVIMTYPVAFNMLDSLPGGLEDQLVLTWAMASNIHKYETCNLDVFNTNTFFPHKDTLAYSEHMIGPAFLVWPFALATGNIIFAYNMLFLLTFVLAGYCMFLLAKYLTGNRYAGLVAGIIYAFLPYRIEHTGHIHLLISFWIPLVFLYLHRYFDGGRAKDLVLSAIFVICQALCFIHYFLYIYVFAGIYILSEMAGRNNFRDGKKWLGILLYSAGIAVALLPFFLPYIGIRSRLGLGRVLVDLEPGSADILSYLAAGNSNLVWGRLKDIFIDGERNLFPGIMAYAAALAGIYFAVKKGVPRNMRLKYYLVVLALGFLFSLGPQVFCNGQRICSGPFTFLFKYMPGYYGTRAPARFFSMFAFALAVFAGYGASLVNRKNFRRVIIVLLFVEYLSKPVYMGRIETKPDKLPEVYRWLANQETPGTVLELPIGSSSTEWNKSVKYMYYSVYHWRKLVNGFNSFFPPEYGAFTGIIEDEFPSARTLDLLDYMKVRYILFHGDGHTGKRTAEIRELAKRYPSRIEEHRVFDGDTVYLNRRDIYGDNDSFRDFVDYYDDYSMRTDPGFREKLVPFRSMFAVDAGKDNRINMKSGRVRWDYFNRYRGWAEAEEWGCWGTGPESVLMLSFPRDIPSYMHVKWAPPPDNERDTQEVKVSLNGNVIGEFKFRQAGYWNKAAEEFNYETYTVKLPRRYLSGGVEEVKFSYGHTCRMNTKYDRRELSAAFESVSFSR